MGNWNTSYLKEGGEGNPAKPGNSRRVTTSHRNVHDPHGTPRQENNKLPLEHNKTNM